jgi:acyl carrier protein
VSECVIRQIWEEVLEVAPIGIAEPFAHVGGDSLKAARILARFQQRFDLNVSFRAFLAVGTIAGLAQTGERFAVG